MADEITLDAPETRIERFLAAAAGMDGITLDEPVTRIEKYLYKIAQNAGGALPAITAADKGKVMTVNDGVWTDMGELQPANNLSILADADQDGSISTYSTIDYIGAGYLYNRGCLLVEIYRNGVFEQMVKCDFATNIGDGLSWIFRGNYYDTLSNEPKTLAVHFTPPLSPDSTPASITIINTEPINKFIVTLTPTAADFSGTMDKTAAEIDAAYEAGREIWFEISDGTVTAKMLVDVVGNSSYTYPSFEAKFIADGNMFVRIFTGMTNDGTEQTYYTAIYPLTPAT